MTLTHEPTGNAPQPWEDVDNDEDLDDHLPRRRFTALTGILAILVVGAGAFLGGVLVQKHHDHGLAATTVSTAASTTGTGRTAAGTGTGTGRGGFGAGATVGQVKLVDGKTIYVTDSSGNTVTINTTNASTYTKSQSVTLKDIQPGDTVIIRGAAQTDGSVSATSVTDSGTAGAAGLGGGRGFGGAGAGAGAGTGAGTGATGTGAAATGSGG